MGGGFALLGLADELHDTSQGAVLFGPGHPHHQSAPVVEGASRHRVTPLFGGWLGLPGEGGFVDRALAFAHLPVGRHQLARQDCDEVAGDERGHRHLRLRTVRTEPAGLLRGAIEQGVDGPAGPVHRVVLDGARGREKEEQEHALKRLTHDPRPGGGQEHEQVDVDPPMPAQRMPAFPGGLPGARAAGGRGQRPAQPGGPSRQFGCECAEAEQTAGERERAEHPPFPRMVVAVVVRASVHATQAVVAATDGQPRGRTARVVAYRIHVYEKRVATPKKLLRVN